MIAQSRFISKGLLCTALYLLTGLSLQGQNISARAEVSPEVVMEGVSAEYTITIVNSSRLPNINTPRIDGLAFDDPPSTSSFQQIVNGRASIETRATWSFQATRTGAFTIPGRTLRISGEEVRVPPASFEVVPMGEETRSRAFLQLEVADGPYYVGQAIPAKLGLFVRNDLSLANIAFPEREGDAFLNGEFDNNPQRSRVRLRGRIYEAFVWDFILTPIKAGPATLQFSQQVALQIPVSDNSMPSIFNLRRSRTEQLTLRSELVDTEILQLPKEDRPPSFSDAVGAFEISADLSSRDLQVGEPLTLTLALEGRGNFDRIAAPELSGWDNWRVYPPKVTFTPSGELGHEGRKVFEYILIPRLPTIEQIPEIAVSSFNPETRAYETTIIEAEPVTVRPSDSLSESRPFSFEGDEGVPSGSQVPDSLLPIRPNIGSLTASGSPWSRPGFVISNSALAALFLFLGVWNGRRQRLRHDQRHARRQVGNRRIRSALQKAREAASGEDPAAFYKAARSAIQERLSLFAREAVQARTLVSSDCEEIMREASLPESLRTDCLQILASADACEFAGHQPPPEALSRQAADLERVLIELNRVQK